MLQDDKITVCMLLLSSAIVSLQQQFPPPSHPSEFSFDIIYQRYDRKAIEN